MERLLERVSLSRFKDNFILKGGMLVSSIVGLDNRATMDIDTTVRKMPLRVRAKIRASGKTSINVSRIGGQPAAAVAGRCTAVCA